MIGRTFLATMKLPAAAMQRIAEWLDRIDILQENQEKALREPLARDY